MEWKKVNISSLYLNGLKWEAALRSKKPNVVTIPSLLEFILNEFGIMKLTDKDLEKMSKERGIVIPS